MELLTAEIKTCLLENGRKNAELVANGVDTFDFPPVVKLFTPDAGFTWLLSEIDPENSDIAFGLCDLGIGCPEVGYVSLSEIACLRGKSGLPVERDCYFKSDKTLSAYADEAHRLGHIRA
ncbi:MAG: DUF2958 domain-containing protein [Acidobacteriaceae bacterium]|nr:DUF2958 domain-containing protein [Acidobacteriaceae bacterium]